MGVPSASPLFLREAEIRRGMELIYFAYTNYTAANDAILEREGLGRAHHRALYFIARQPDMTVGDLLRLLRITKQSLGRVLTDLGDRNFLESRPGQQDRRQRLLRLTTAGEGMEASLFEPLRAHMAAAYAEAGQGSVTGFWRVLEALIPHDQRGRIAELDGGRS